MNNPPPTESPYLLSAKVRAPSLARGYIRCNELLRRIEPLRRLTILRAPSGFGKTGILADIARRWREQDRLVAWLTLDEDDTAGVLDMYLAYAFQVAGLNVSAAEGDAGDGGDDGQRPRRRMELLAASIETHAAPCLLILDEVERLSHRMSLASVNFLLLHGPRNLHIALGMRENPGLDLGGAVLTHRGFYVTADQLRFTKPQIARFFNNELSRRELDDLAERSEGWPVALRTYRNMKTHTWMKDVAVQDLVGDRGVMADWLGERLLRDLAPEDRTLLLDLSLFDRITPEVAADVLRTDNIRRRVETLASLEGLLQIDNDANTVRLHPLLKDHCAARCYLESPSRFRAVHAGIARAEARQGHIVAALGHAREAGDAALTGEVIEDAGGVRLWASLGAEGLIAVDDYLNDEVVEAFPRAGLLRVVVLGQMSRFQEASSLYARLSAATEGFQRDRATGGDDRALQLEHVLVQVTMASFSCQPFRTPAVQKMLRHAEAFVQAEGADLIVKGALNMTLSIVDQMRARFSSAARHGAAGMDAFSRAGAGHGNTFMHLHLGTLEFARGRGREAMEHYTHGYPTMLADLLAFEVAHERGVARPRRSAPDLVGLPNLGWFEVYAAIYSVASELVLECDGPRAALSFVGRALLRSRTAGLPAVERFLSILRVFCLTRCGLVEQAAQAWEAAELPVDQHDILDVDRQSWREMEALACTRFRLHCESGAYDSALEIGAGLRTLGRQRGLWRPLMNGVALSMASQWQSGNAERAMELLSEFLSLADSVDYVRPLVRVREQTLAVLPVLIDEAQYAPYHEAAATLLEQLAAETDAPTLTDRELAIMRDVARGLRNKEIAKGLGITENGVRYHLKNIYRKTGAKGRIDAVHRTHGLIDAAFPIGAPSTDHAPNYPLR